MDLWFSEEHVPGVRFSIKVEHQIHHETSWYQQIDVFATQEFGRVLTLDGFIMVTEKDEYIYHEMMTHVPMAVRRAQDVLVIGAGDGGTVRELCKYDCVQHIDMVELDQRVVEVCKQHFPQTACCFDDPRLSLHFQDGIRYVRGKQNAYDLIIIDSTDPFGPGEALFTREFYGNCLGCLREDGLMVCQMENTYYQVEATPMRKATQHIRASFPGFHVYQAFIPTYPSGHWLFGFASKGAHPVVDLDAEGWNALGIRTKYYNTALHAGSFALPTDVMEALGL